MPLMIFGIEIAIKSAGVNYVTINNLWRFLSDPISLFSLMILFYLLSQFILIEIYFLTFYFSVREKQKKVQVFSIVATSIYKVLTGMVRGNFRLIFVAWTTLIVANIPFCFFMMRKNRLFSYLFEIVPDSWVWLAVIFIFIGFIGYLLYGKAFLFHYLLVDKKPIEDSIKHAKVTKLVHPNLTLLYYMGWNFFEAVLLTLFYALIIAITMVIVSTTADKRVAVAAFITINERLTGYIAVLLFLVGTISHFALFTHLFHHYKLAPKTFAIDKVHLPNTISKPSYKRIVITLFVILIGINLQFFIGAMRNGSILNAIRLDSIEITAHRGFSQGVPENTIPAIIRAIEEQADYVEVDVRSTKDGELVLLHDSNLRRTTGLNQMIWDVTYDEIKELDAGSWMSDEYKNVRIPTLREVFELTKGEVNFNIDLKYSGNQDDVVINLVELIREYNMEWQCIVTSTSLSYLEEIKSIDPNIKTGYISHRYVSSVVKSDYIDVLSMKSNLVTKSVIEEIHQNGKLIFVWTVNTKREIERMSRLGVDNIITDNPVYTREVIYQSDTDNYLVTLFKIVME